MSDHYTRIMLARCGFDDAPDDWEGKCPSCKGVTRNSDHDHEGRYAQNCDTCAVKCEGCACEGVKASGNWCATCYNFCPECGEAGGCQSGRLCVNCALESAEYAKGEV